MLKSSELVYWTYCIFITHRLSTVKSSDLILVMHQGRLEESGTHSELIQKNARMLLFINSRVWVASKF